MADKKVVVYSTPTCPWCRRAKDYLKEKGVEFEERDVAADREAAREMVAKSKQMSVPVITVGDEDVVVGFNQVLLDKLLAPGGQKG